MSALRTMRSFLRLAGRHLLVELLEAHLLWRRDRRLALLAHELRR